MANWFTKNIISFSGEEENKPDEVKKSTPAFLNTQQAPVSQPVYSPAQQAPATGMVVATQATVDIAKYRQHLKEVIRGANLEGPDYLEFIDIMEGNKALNLMPQVAIVVAYNSLKTMAGDKPMNKQVLLDAAGHYITVLNQDFEKFKASVEQKRVADVGGRESQIQQLDADNQQKMEQIQKLNEEIAANTQKKQQLTIEKMQFDDKYNSALAGMQTAVQAEISDINANVQNIQIAIQ
jgi:glutamate racemase